MNDRALRILTAAILHAGARLERQAAENFQSGSGGEEPGFAEALAKAQELIEAAGPEAEPLDGPAYDRQDAAFSGIGRA